LRLFFALMLALAAAPLIAQQAPDQSAIQSTPQSAEQQQPEQAQNPVAAQALARPDAQSLPDAPLKAGAQSQIPLAKQQPKRILGIMPNFRAVSAGEIPPPPTPRQALKIATQNSFDYSSFFFVGVTSLIAEASNAHPALGKGVPGYWGYYWRGYLDKTDGNYLVIFAMPTIFHEDVRYYAEGEGSIWKRGIYAGSRVLITRDYHGHDTVNASEILGRGTAQAISISYYPSKDRTAGEIMQKYGYAIGRDALTNVLREFWPDIAVHVLHRHP